MYIRHFAAGPEYNEHEKKKHLSVWNIGTCLYICWCMHGGAALHIYRLLYDQQAASADEDMLDVQTASIYLMMYNSIAAAGRRSPAASSLA